MGLRMSPLSKKELVTLTECATKIQHLEEAVRELKQEVGGLRKEKKESRQRISDRRLAIYLTAASILGGLILKIIEWLASLKG
jgi:hypothetical protein